MSLIEKLLHHKKQESALTPKLFKQYEITERELYVVWLSQDKSFDAGSEEEAIENFREQSKTYCKFIAEDEFIWELRGQLGVYYITNERPSEEFIVNSNFVLDPEKLLEYERNHLKEWFSKVQVEEKLPFNHMEEGKAKELRALVQKLRDEHTKIDETFACREPAFSGILSPKNPKSKSH